MLSESVLKNINIVGFVYLNKISSFSCSIVFISNRTMHTTIAVVNPYNPSFTESQVRDQAQQLLLKLMLPASSPQVC